MGRNTHIRSHRYIPKQKKKPKPTFNWNGIVTKNRIVNGFNMLNELEKTTVLNGCLILIPWTYIFLMG